MTRFANYTIAGLALAVAGCGSAQKEHEMGTYGYDAKFLRDHRIETLELTGADDGAKILVAPGLQGRVMTSTSDGDGGDSYGWINYRFVESGERNPQFNPVGGEERFWIGPEGGAFSYYFKPGDEQIYANWVVPAVIDTERYDIREQSADRVTFAKSAELVNASGVPFRMDIARTVSLLDAGAVARVLGTELPADVKVVAYESRNTITNRGAEAWTRQTGLPSIWLLGMFTPTPTTTVFIPYDPTAEGAIVNDTYFGKVPADRLVAEDGMLRFRIDGKYRAKIGIPAPRARGICGSYDTEKQVLTLVKYSQPEGPADYVNGQWGQQEDAFNGDVINAYNDGPVEDGSIMGPFYEIETSSPGAALAPGESLTHCQAVLHIQGDEATLAGIVQSVFGYDLRTIAATFR